WDALVGAGSPFMEWDWLGTLEEARCVLSETGWLPQHLTLWEGERLLGACPLYVKSHSLGEVVFDRGWAAAAARAGMEGHPKITGPTRAFAGSTTTLPACAASGAIRCDGNSASSMRRGSRSRRTWARAFPTSSLR